MSQTSGNKFIAAIVIVVAPFAMGAFFMAWSPAGQYQLTDPHNDGYVQPRDIGGLVAHTQRSTVMVNCEAPGKESLGSAWAVTLEKKAYAKYDNVFITNHHVIEDCIGKEQYLTVHRLFAKDHSARIITLDKKNDLAVIVSDLKIPTLKLSQYEPSPGYWTMVVGSADGYQGSVAFGSVLNINQSEVLITANASHGNSGGPVVDNEGNVIGTLTQTVIGEQYNVAKSLDAMCSKIVKCDGRYYWAE
jgi:S1-C subfamily serine protease